MIKGVIAGAFDIIHPGYCRLFKECKNNCDYLTIALHVDPSIERNKIKPIHTVEERIEILLSLEAIDSVVPYYTEKDLVELYKNFDKIFIGEEYKHTNYTGKSLNIPVTFIKREHNYSSTKTKKKIYDSMKQQ